MATIDDIARKIRAKGQKAKGEVEQQSGRGVKGGISKAQGTVNDAVADFNLKSKPRRGTDGVL